ncbi:hypothetical protein M9H77_20970 [Catharanthus roseus]|uniref:Uncharacterized protein n=2 Tax=Catharanthus roseus TaxID=4058 RepID=A0ACC0ALP7_CATRO|nr:hypothetical protein M9H77_20969 [Catharanthus roseus]KAI5661647.1 hypothetical protein M9H77_20970 [Catharanthus roseus]
MRREEDAVSRVSAIFGEHMRWLFKHNHLAYIPFPPMMPLIRNVMSVNPSTSSSTAAATGGTSEVTDRNFIGGTYRGKCMLSLSPSMSVTDDQKSVGNAVGVCYR